MPLRKGFILFYFIINDFEIKLCTAYIKHVFNINRKLNAGVSRFFQTSFRAHLMCTYVFMGNTALYIPTPVSQLLQTTSKKITGQHRLGTQGLLPLYC